MLPITCEDSSEMIGAKTLQRVHPEKIAKWLGGKTDECDENVSGVNFAGLDARIFEGCHIRIGAFLFLLFVR